MLALFAELLNGLVWGRTKSVAIFRYAPALSGRLCVGNQLHLPATRAAAPGDGEFCREGRN